MCNLCYRCVYVCLNSAIKERSYNNKEKLRNFRDDAIILSVELEILERNLKKIKEDLFKTEKKGA